MRVPSAFPAHAGAVPTCSPSIRSRRWHPPRVEDASGLPAGTGAGPSRETSPTPSIRSRELARRVEFCDARLEVTTATSDVRKGQWH
ncbi:hypothetical protein PAHAL_6G217300 [Panicum hallii]|uniref:Uncharacterized protein n=1 Tax=Panicum hallii TaxID=206008 RepID=A0A2T8IH57_9POAL|nr:hypothetical protein PAHAL_6G217300 [Panicum hallii]